MEVMKNIYEEYICSSNTDPYFDTNIVTEAELCERVQDITEKSSPVYLFYWMVSCEGESMNDLWENSDYHNFRALFWRYQPSAYPCLDAADRELGVIKTHSEYASKSCQWMFGPIPPNNHTYVAPEGLQFVDADVYFVEYAVDYGYEREALKNDTDITQYNKMSGHEFCFIPNTKGWIPTCRTRGEPSEYSYQLNTWESEDHDYMMEAYETGGTFKRYVGFYKRVHIPDSPAWVENIIYIEFDCRAKSDTSGSTVTNLKVMIYSEDWQTQVGETWSVINGGVGIDSGWLNGKNHTFENIPKGAYYNVFIYYNDAWSANWHHHIYIKNIYLGNVAPVLVPPAKHEYLFNKGSGVTIYDNVHSLDGDITGADWSSESFNEVADNCLEFDGSNDYVNLDDDPDWSFASGEDLSISAWIEPDSTSGRNTILAKYAGSSNKEYILQVYNGRINFKVFDDAGGNYIGAKSNQNTISANTWYHVVVTYNGGTSSSDIKIYINSFESSNGLSSGYYEGMSDTNAKLYVGRRGDTSSYKFDGKIDNVRFFNEELSPSEVLLLYDTDALN